MLFERVRILCSVIIIASILVHLFFFSRGTCILDGLRKMLQNTKVDDFKKILFKCLECRRYFTNAWKSICHVRRKFIRNNYAHLFI